jgi:hypothetical protein
MGITRCDDLDAGSRMRATARSPSPGASSTIRVATSGTMSEAELGRVLRGRGDAHVAGEPDDDDALDPVLLEEPAELGAASRRRSPGRGR